MVKVMIQAEDETIIKEGEFFSDSLLKKRKMAF